MKKVLITGAGSGLGRGTAIGLAQAGHRVIATTQIWPQVAELRRQVEELGLTRPDHRREARRARPPRRPGRDRLGLRHLPQQRRHRRRRADGRDPGRSRPPHLRDQRAGTGISMQTINPGAYDTGFNDRLGESTYHWHDDATGFTREDDIRAHFAEIMKGQHDPQDMIDKMVEVIGAEEGKYRTVRPPATEDPIKQVQAADWRRAVRP